MCCYSEFTPSIEKLIKNMWSVIFNLWWVTPNIIIKVSFSSPLFMNTLLSAAGVLLLWSLHTVTINVNSDSHGGAEENTSYKFNFCNFRSTYWGENLVISTFQIYRLQLLEHFFSADVTSFTAFVIPSNPQFFFFFWKFSGNLYKNTISLFPILYGWRSPNSA